MTTATDILTQLEELWEAAEPGPFRQGDTIIIHRHNGEYGIRPRAGYDSEGAKFSHVRVLERAKSKRPEWEAVVASYIHDEEHRREVYFRASSGGWESDTRILHADDLVDPVPLVELPERSDLHELFRRQCLDGWPGAGVLADAVLELLRGER